MISKIAHAVQFTALTGQRK